MSTLKKNEKNELVESLEDIIGQIQRDKIGLDLAIKILGNIYYYYKHPGSKPYERLKKEWESKWPIEPNKNVFYHL